GQLTLTRNPTLAHTGTWAIGSSTWNASDATIYANPASPTADSNIFALAKAGSVQFAVDAEGDIYGNNLILTGSTSTGSTTVIGNLTVEGNTQLGDATTDTLTIYPATLTLSKEAAHTIQIADSTTANTAGGALTIKGAAGTATNAAGGAINITGGTGAGTGNGGSLVLTAGAAGATGTGGAISLTTTTGIQTFTSSVTTGTTTSSGFVFDATAITSGTGAYLTSDSVTTGRLLDVATTGNTWTGNGTTNGLANITSTSTAGTASASSILLQLSRSGANAQLAHTAYGVYSAVTNTNVTSGTNVAGYFSASGAQTANYGLIVENGSVGIGTTAPTSKLHVYTSAATDTDTIVNIETAGTNRASQINLYSTINTYGSISHFASGTKQWQIGNNGDIAAGGFGIYTTASITNRLAILSGGNVGIGTTAPDAALEINHATGDSLRLTYNDADGTAANYTDFSLSSTGALTLTGSAATLAASATAEKTFLTLTPGTITLTAPTAVTSLMETAV
ncbi:MAG: hypothetical protein Q7J73_04790, partial [Dehalococcoidales bacterium]|nr:hypothetical protein [Dehalococcoidales bacterium]